MSRYGNVVEAFCSITDLDCRSVHDAYITFESRIARMDPHKSVDDNERKLVDRARVPTVIGNATKTTQAKVSQNPLEFLPQFVLMRTILPYILDAYRHTP